MLNGNPKPDDELPEKKKYFLKTHPLNFQCIENILSQYRNIMNLSLLVSCHIALAVVKIVSKNAKER